MAAQITNHIQELEGELRRILLDHARALEEQRRGAGLPLRRRIYEILCNLAEIQEAQETKDQEFWISISVAFLSGITLVPLIVWKILAVF